MINNRVDGKPVPGSPANKYRVGDYDTPEQTIGGFNRQEPWETCMTICQQWAWKPDDKLKSLPECIETLVQTVGGDGNLLLNVGPMPDGRIEPRQVERLKEMGAWLAKYGEGIYGSRGGPFMPGKWGASTCKGESVYLFVSRWPDEGPLKLPAIARKISAARLFGGKEITIAQTDAGIAVDVPKADRTAPATVIVLSVGADALAIEPVKVP